ncbi:hypothetical protein ACTQ3V_15445, partial [Candidatus Agathobaculum pullicola]
YHVYRQLHPITSDFFLIITYREGCCETLSTAPSCPEAVGSVPTPEHAAGMGQEAFSGRMAKVKTEGLHEKKSI